MKVIDRTPKPYTGSDKPNWIDSSETIAFIPNYPNHMINVNTKEIYFHCGGPDDPLSMLPVLTSFIGGMTCVIIPPNVYGNERQLTITVLNLFALAFAGRMTNMCYARALDGDVSNLEMMNIEWCDYTFNDETQTLKLFEFSPKGNGDYNLYLKEGMYTQCTSWHLMQICGIQEVRIDEMMDELVWDLCMDRSSWVGQSIETLPYDPNMMVGIGNVIMYDYLAITHFIEIYMNVDTEDASLWRENIEYGYNVPLTIKGIQR